MSPDFRNTPQMSFTAKGRWQGQPVELRYNARLARLEGERAVVQALLAVLEEQYDGVKLGLEPSTTSTAQEHLRHPVAMLDFLSQQLTKPVFQLETGLQRYLQVDPKTIY